MSFQYYTGWSFNELRCALLRSFVWFDKPTYNRSDLQFSAVRNSVKFCGTYGDFLIDHEKLHFIYPLCDYFIDHERLYFILRLPPPEEISSKLHMCHRPTPAHYKKGFVGRCKTRASFLYTMNKGSSYYVFIWRSIVGSDAQLRCI